MEKMRNTTGVILWVLIISFGVLWMLSDVNFFDAMSAGPRSLGSVNGDDISIEEYQSRIQYYSNAYSQQTGNSMTPEMRAYYENQVWDDLVNSRLLEQKMDELGITVTDNEVLNMVYGENPDPIIRQNFTREDGTIDRAAVQRVLSSNEFTQQAVALEVQLRQKRRQQKLQSYVQAGLQVTERDVEEEFMQNNTFAEVSFLRFPYSEVANEDITVEESELRNYYENNKENYRREESYRIKYVTFSKQPTSRDTSQIVSEVRELRTAFAEAPDDSLFLARQGSSTEYRNAYVTEDEIREEYKPVLDLEVGEVTDVILTANQAMVLKKTDERGDEVSFQILSYNIQALPATIDDANEKAADFEFYASEESSFEEEAERRELEVQEGFATKGNNFISGLGSSQLVMNFLETADEGEVSDVLELSSEFVVLKVMEKTEEGYRPFDEVRTQVENLVKIENRKSITLERVNEMLAANSSLEALAEAAGKEIQTVDNLVASTTTLSGAGREPEVIGVIFAMDAGETSSTAFKGNSAAFVVRVNGKTEADLSTLTQAQRNQIRQRLEQQKNQKYMAVWLEQLREGADIVDNRDRLLRP